MTFNYHGLYFDLQLHTSVLSWLRYSNNFSKLVHFLSEATNSSILKLNFPFSLSLTVQTERLVSKL
jgi:hypothetical protein